MGGKQRPPPTPRQDKRPFIITFRRRHRQQLASVPREGGCAATRVLARAYGASLGVERVEKRDVRYVSATT